LIERATSDRGVSMIEVVIAALLLIIGALAVLGFADTANRNTYRSEQGQVAVDRLQAEMEKLRQLPFDEVALTAAPSTSTDPASPAHRVGAGGTTFALNRDGSNVQPLAVQGHATPGGNAVGCGANGQPACGVDPGPTPFQSGDVSGQIYRYVVYPGVPSNCTGCTADDLKRIIVVISLDHTAQGGTRAYQEIQSDIASERDRSGSPPCTNCGGGNQIATFWLTDTPCNNTTRQDVSLTDHDSHNTRGTCTDGPHTGSTKGAPDLMFNEQPATGSNGQNPFIDYANDVEPNGVPTSTDKGIQLLKPTLSGSTGCLLAVPTLSLTNSLLDLPGGALGGEPNKQQKMHIWLSNELDPNFRLLTTSSATLEIYTKSDDGSSTSGKFCFWVFKRVKLVGLNLLGQQVTFWVDLPAVVTSNNSFLYGQFQRAFWPSDWSPISVPMNLTFTNVTSWLPTINLGALGLTSLSVSGQPRLGLALQVERTNTTGSAIQFMYDHPSFPSRLEVQSTSCILLC
jgi:hypothetical protein